MISEAIKKIVAKQDLNYDEAYAVMNEIMNTPLTFPPPQPLLPQLPA